MEPPLKPSLASLERKVASLVVAGYTDAEIASFLSVGTPTVEWSVAKLCRALGTETRDELVSVLSRSGPAWSGRPGYEPRPIHSSPPS